MKRILGVLLLFVGLRTESETIRPARREVWVDVAEGQVAIVASQGRLKMDSGAWREGWTSDPMLKARIRKLRGKLLARKA